MLREFGKGRYDTQSTLEVGDKVTFEVWDSKKKVGVFTRVVVASPTGLPRVQYGKKLCKLNTRKAQECYYAGERPFEVKVFWVKK